MTIAHGWNPPPNYPPRPRRKISYTLAEELKGRPSRVPDRPRCEGEYQHPHHPGEQCVDKSRFVINGIFYCTKHAWVESLRIILEE